MSSEQDKAASSEGDDRSGGDTVAPRQARAPVTSKTRVGGIALIVAVAALTAIGLAMRRETTSIPGLDGDLCPVEEGVSASATYLIDLRKPIDPAARALPADRLRDVTQSLTKNAELLVYALQSDRDAPRQRIGRICKPYDNAAIQALAKDGGELRDCDSVPAQVSTSLRVAARLYCERREAIAEGITTLGATEPHTPLASAHLIEALDDTALEFESRQAPHQLHIFSDMLHHAVWYSHFDIDWEWWPTANLVSMRPRSSPAVESSVLRNADIAIYHVIRRDLTEQPRARRALRQFWQSYFQQETIGFVYQPTMDGYDAIPLMELKSKNDQAQFMLEQERAAVARERERLRQEAARLARLEARLMRQELRQAREAQLSGSQAAEGGLAPEAVPLEE